MANGHKHNRGGGGRLLVDSVVDAAGDDEEDGQDKKGNGEPLLARDAVRKADEAHAAGNGGQGHRQQILLCLLYQHVVNGVARLRLVCLPDREPRSHPARHGGVATGERRVPTRELAVDGRGLCRSPHVGEGPPIIERETIETNVQKEPCCRCAKEIVPIAIAYKVVAQIFPGKLDRHGPGGVFRVHAVGGVHLRVIRCIPRGGAIDTLRIHNGHGGLILNLEAVEAAVKQEEAEDDGQEGRHGTRPDDDAPDAVDGSATLLLVQGVEPALHGLEVVGVVEANEHEQADDLGQGLSHGLHEEDTGKHA